MKNMELRSSLKQSQSHKELNNLKKVNYLPKTKSIQNLKDFSKDLNNQSAISRIISDKSIREIT